MNAVAKKAEKKVTPKAEKKPRPRKRLDAAELAAVEANLRKKYDHIVEGSLRDIGTQPDTKFHNKRSVEIRCQWEGCTKTRRIATSDLAQVRYCEEHTHQARLERRRTQRKDAKPKKPAKPK